MPVRQRNEGICEGKTLPDNSGVAVCADGTWQAMQALSIHWGTSTAEVRSSDKVREELNAGAQGDSTYQTCGVQAAAVALVDGAVRIIDKTFNFSLLAQAPMEPIACANEPTMNGGTILHDSAQFPKFGYMTPSQVLGLPMEKV